MQVLEKIIHIPYGILKNSTITITGVSEAIKSWGGGQMGRLSWGGGRVGGASGAKLGLKVGSFKQN